MRGANRDYGLHKNGKDIITNMIQPFLNPKILPLISTTTPNFI